MHSNRSIPSQIRVSQSSVDVYTAIPGDLLAMVWGSVSYGKKYSEGYPKIFVTAVHIQKTRAEGSVGGRTSTQKLLMVLVKTKAGGAAPPYATGSLHASVGMGV